jgi:hypothetical protein
MNSLGDLKSDGSKEEPLVVNWEAFFGLDHGLELGDGVGVVYFDLDSLGRVYLDVDGVAGGEFGQRSFSEAGFSTRFGILKQDLIELENLDILWDTLRGNNLVLDT